MKRNNVVNKLRKDGRVGVRKRINKKIRNLKDRGLEGKEYRYRSYRIKMIEERRAINQRYIKPTPENIELIRDRALKTGMIDRFKKNQQRSQFYMLIETKQQLFRIANRFNMFELIFENLRKFEIDREFPCELIEGNRAWISKSEETEKYRYFTKRPGERPYSLSIFDLIEIVNGYKGFQCAAEELARLLDLNNLQDEWEMVQREKYQANIDYLDSSEVKIKRKYTTLYRYIHRHIELLKHLNEYGMEHVNRLFMHEGKHLFYLATTELAKHESLELDQPEANRALNMLALLGLIKKIPYGDLSSHIQAVAKGIRGNNKSFRYVTFYQVPPLNADVLLQAEKMAKKLETVGIRGDRDISKRNVGKFLGGVVFKSIYHSFPEGYEPTDRQGRPDDDEVPF
ncbi:hypothetical protein JJQ72_16730 [Paenibacillus sp. F411]|uniref:hypothetical protein n=1 Tax=Paenibacillus sp. F411 TaxID=2820239 RepID=UPI001AAEB59E|nr:hypothetical protein [Paenibacillus sp. F411]MBO2945626.1 hypothetical protein [Paenibacillus sp. F411]